WHTSATTPRAESDLDGTDQAVVQNLSCDDCRVSARVLNFSAGVAELDLRQQPSNDRYDVALLANGNLQVRRHNGATITVLSEAPSGIATLDDWATIGLQATGSNPVNLVASANGVTKVIVNDSSASRITAAGTAGIWTNLAGIWFGNFTVNGAPAGGSDGGTPDAGPPDAGPPDAGSPDAGPPDAGPPDAGPPQTGVLFSDDFNRTLASGLGPKWTIVSGGWRDNDKANSDADTLDRAAPAGVSCADCRADAKMVNFGGGESMLELRASGSDRYALALTAGGTLEVRRYRGGVKTVIGSVGSGIADLTIWHSFSFAVQGGAPVTLTGWVDGVPKITATDSTTSALTAPGAAGIAATVSGILFDDYSLSGTGTSSNPPADGGTPDAGPPDAGTPDAGTPDAGTPDAGTPDAGTPDAGTPDAGTPDAGTPDGGGTLSATVTYT